MQSGLKLKLTFAMTQNITADNFLANEFLDWTGAAKKAMRRRNKRSCSRNCDSLHEDIFRKTLPIFKRCPPQTSSRSWKRNVARSFERRSRERSKPRNAVSSCSSHQENSAPHLRKHRHPHKWLNLEKQPYKMAAGLPVRGSSEQEKSTIPYYSKWITSKNTLWMRSEPTAGMKWRLLKATFESCKTCMRCSRSKHEWRSQNSRRERQTQTHIPSSNKSNTCSNSCVKQRAKVAKTTWHSSNKTSSSCRWPTARSSLGMIGQLYNHLFKTSHPCLKSVF